MSYFLNKEERARKAVEHTQEMWNTKEFEIKAAIADTHIYSDKDRERKKLYQYPIINKNKNFLLWAEDSVSAIFKADNTYPNKKIAVLNFASYKNPGGMFINGSSAQEESLCHESFLYNVLESFMHSYYSWNRHNLNRALYTNRMLYTPQIEFQRGKDHVFADVITCAAPNKKAAQQYQNVSNKENHQVLVDRISFLLEMADSEGVQTLILGAYGSGVFGQDASEVARIFIDLISRNDYCFETVIFAIPTSNDKRFYKFNDNYDAFIDVLNSFNTSNQSDRVVKYINNIVATSSTNSNEETEIIKKYFDDNSIYFARILQQDLGGGKVYSNENNDHFYLCFNADFYDVNGLYREKNNEIKNWKCIDK